MFGRDLRQRWGNGGTGRGAQSIPPGRPHPVTHSGTPPHPHPQPPGEVCGRTLIDVGSGPTIYQLLSACDHFEEVVATDFLEVNREELQRWVRGEPGAFDWSPFIQHVCKIEGRG